MAKAAQQQFKSLAQKNPHQHLFLKTMFIIITITTIVTTIVSFIIISITTIIPTIILIKGAYDNNKKRTPINI